MFEKISRWPLAALAGGLLAFAPLAGCATARQPEQSPAEAHGHSAMDHSKMNHSEMDHSAMDHSKMDHSEMDHSAMGHADHAPAPVAVAPGQPGKTLSPDALDAPAETSVLDARRAAEIAEEMTGGGHGAHGGGHGGHGGHGSSSYRLVDAGREPAADQDHDHGAHGHGEAHQHGDEAAGAPYVCPMHPEVTSETPGKCPKCGMDLVQRRKE